MRTKLLLLGFFAVLALSSFVFLKPSEKKSIQEITTPPVPPDNGGFDKFYVGAMVTEAGSGNNYSNLNQLGLNLWHNYINSKYDAALGRHIPYGWLGENGSDQLFANVSSYAGEVTTKMSNIYNASPENNRRKMLLMRPKITWLSFGQNSIYECEDTNYVDPDLWFYAFNNHGAYSTVQDNTWGAGHYVKRCEQANNDAGWVVSRLKANTEQSTDNSAEHAWEGDTECDWYIKPRIRIDSAFANNATNFNKLVCRVDIKNQWDILIHSIDIRVRNFKQHQDSMYRGSYLEKFFFSPYNDTSTQFRKGAWGKDWYHAGRGNSANDVGVINKADIKVYWYDNCDMWLDYIKVENDVANDLLDIDPSNANHVRDSIWIKDEAQLIGNYTVGGVKPGLKFYLELVQFNNLSCMAYVNNILKQYGNVDLMQDLTVRISAHVPWEQSWRVENADFLSEHYIQKVGFTQIFAECYAINSCYKQGGSGVSFAFSKIPNTLPVTVDEKVLSEPVSPAAYDTWLQENLDYYPSVPEGGSDISCGTTICDTDTSYGLPQERGYFRYKMKLCNQISKMANVPFIFMPHSHQWFHKYEVRREPTNEEMQLIANLVVSYGAKGLQYFWYPSFGNSCYYGTGMANSNGNLIEENYYGQGHSSGFPYKWETIQNISDRLTNKWGTYLMSFDPDYTNSYIYYNETERTNLIANSYFNSAYSTVPLPSDFDSPDFDNLDAPNNTYIQVATFKNTDEQFNKYFIVVNRRASPFVSENSYGGRRNIFVSFDANAPEFAGFNNWKIIDLEDNSTVGTFNKTQLSTINLNWFMPAQGKLYKIAPVMQEGGTFVTNESFGGSNLSVNCKDNVFNGGYNLTIAAETEVLFNQGKKIVMEGGSFLCGGVRETWTSEVIGTDVKLKGLTGSTYWDGIEFNNCNTISIGGTRFERIRSNNLYALNVMNCNTLRVRYNLFLSGSNNPQTGSVSFNFIPVGIAREPVIEITGNQFYHNNSDLPSVQIMNYSAGQTSALVRFNEFYGYNSAVGLLMDNVTGGSIKSNIMQNYINSIATSVSYIDLYKNHIVSSADTSEGLSINSGSVANLNFNSNVTYQNSGMNKMINSSSHSHNIVTDNSFFTIKGGFNSFDVINGGTHFFGTFDDYYGSSKQDAEYNCFKIDGSDNVHYTDVNWYSGGEVEFLTDPYVCEAASEDDFDTVVYADGIIDTLWSYIEGMGGGYSNKLEGKGEMKEERSKLRGKMFSGSAEFELKTDSLNYYLRKRRFNEVKRIGNELTNSFSDSDRVIDIIQPLYFSTMVTDNENSTGISALKTKLEDIIANNSENGALVMRCNYFIQKCKVILEDYSSALSGFYDIMQAYPYSWEGIVAGWDYSATQLVSQQGQGGGLNVRGERLEVRSEILEAKQAEISDESAGEFADEPYGDDPKGVKKTIDKTLNDKKEDAVKQIKVEQQQVKEMKIDIKNDKNIKQSKAIQKKLQQKKTMSEIIKPRKPETVIEHINFVNADIQKIYSISGKSTGVEDNISVPQQYSLSQNYPNPFNPITKIKFELPQESKVTIVIYDILGRKVAQLINNELRQPGRYEVQFNGHNFASGIYFYRIVANEFIDTKRMVLVK